MNPGQVNGATTTQRTVPGDSNLESVPAERNRLGGRVAWRMLIIGTIGFALNFWAWALLSPLGSFYRDKFSLSPLSLSVLVAVPVLVGSLGRIPIGALTDRYGARVMLPLVTFATIPPVLVIGLADDVYGVLIAAGFLLGIGGTSFAVGAPLVSSWFPPERRGMALGIFGVGTVGTAVSSFTTIPLTRAGGHAFPFLLVSALLLVYGLLAAVVIRPAPGRPAASRKPMLRSAWETLKMPVTLQNSVIYAIGFGGFVAFSVYLPTYLKTAYGLSQADAATRTAGFVVLAVAARPIGGWLSDRLHPVPVLVGCLSATAFFAALASLGLELLPHGTVAFLGMAITLGAAAGACFALVGKMAPPEKVGGVTGIVGAAGGLGGFLPPLVMGSIYGARHDYSLGFVLLAVTAAVVALFTATVVRRAARGQS